MSLKQRIINILYPVTVILIFIFAAWVVYFITAKSSRLDFRVFYGAAVAAIKGKQIYTLYGIYMMPFWYFPWVAWLYIPLTFLSFSQAWYTYVILCCFLLWGILTYYSNLFSVTRRLLDKIFLYSISLLLCMMLFNFGQTDIVVLALVTLIVIFLERGNLLQAGIILPLALIKPHILIIFVVACLLKGGKLTFIGASISSLVMFGIEFLLNPNWLHYFFRLFAYGSQRNGKLYWGHTTLPHLLGFEENFVGTANLPIIALLILIGVLVVWKFRAVSPSQLIALSLAASLFCAPRAFGYDIVLLLPAMLLVSRNFNWKTFLSWIAAVTLVFAYNFSTGTYFLTLFVFGITIWKLRAEVTYRYRISPIQSKA